jgi:polyketide cyclase/dehydrase/lipid transport protein
VIKGFAGRTMQNEAEMIEFEPNRRMVVEILDAPVPARIVIEFTPVGGGTRLDWTGIFSPKGILAPTAFLIAQFYRMVFDKDLRNLKALMDRREL